MPDDINTEFKIVLKDEFNPKDAGITPKYEVRVRTQTTEQDEKLIESAIEGGNGQLLVVKCDMVKVFHGTYSVDGLGATLIVLRFEFYTGTYNKRFKSANIKMTFEKGEGAKSLPEIIRIAPSDKWFLGHSVQTQETTYTANATLQIPAGSASSNIGGTCEWKRTEEKDYWVEVSGTTTSIASNNDTVHWAAWENPHTKKGIPARLQTAILLRREIDGKFGASLNIKGQLDRRTETAGKMSRTVSKFMSGSLALSPRVIFNPKVSRGGEVAHPTSLKDEDLEAYKDASEFHGKDDETKDNKLPPAPPPPPPPATTVDLATTSKSTLLDDVGAMPKSSTNPFASAYDYEKPAPYEKPVASAPAPTWAGIPKLAPPSPPPPFPPASSAAPTAEILVPSTPPRTFFTPMPAETPVPGEDRAPPPAPPAKLADLRARLAAVREEAAWIRRLLWLEAEERRIMVEIERCGG